MSTSYDPSDPAARAAAQLRSQRARSTRARVAGATALVLGGLVFAATAGAVTGDPGATIGAIVLVLLFAGIAVVVWPWEWSKAEAEHRQLEALWREIRTDADRRVPWSRYGAWAEAKAATLRLEMIEHLGTAADEASPSPYRRQVVQRLDANDVAGAAVAMERTRAEAAEKELAAHQRYEASLADAERREHEQRLAAIDQESEAEIRAQERRDREEIERQTAADNAAQAEAVARAIRRP